jgi:hypothetical protein
MFEYAIARNKWVIKIVIRSPKEFRFAHFLGDNGRRAIFSHREIVRTVMSANRERFKGEMLEDQSRLKHIAHEKTMAEEKKRRAELEKRDRKRRAER